MDRIGLAFGIGFLLTGACDLADIGTEIKYVGPYQTARPFDCRMRMMFGPLPSPHQDIARARTECPDHLADEELCFDDLRRSACFVGADTVYGIADTREGGVSYLTATFARSLPSPIGAVISGTPARLTCNPICSPGFACRATTCVPECNPGCATGEICTRERLCSPIRAARALKAPPTQSQRAVATVISWGPARAKRDPGDDVDADGHEEPAIRTASTPHLRPDVPSGVPGRAALPSIPEDGDD